MSLKKGCFTSICLHWHKIKKDKSFHIKREWRKILFFFLKRILLRQRILLKLEQKTKDYKGDKSVNEPTTVCCTKCNTRS